MHDQVLELVTHQSSVNYKNKSNIPAARSKILSKLTFASCVRYSDRACYGVCVLNKDIGRRLPLQLQCSLYQGQQGDVNQSVRGNNKNPSVYLAFR